MTIRRINVAFVDSAGLTRAICTGPLDRQMDLVREARESLEDYRRTARQEGDPRCEEHFRMSITEAPPAPEYRIRPEDR